MLAKGFYGKFKSPIVQLGDVVSVHYGKALAAPVRRPGNIPVYGSNGQCGWHDVPLRQGPTVVLGRKGQGPLGVKWSTGPFWVIDTAYYVTVDPARIDLRYFYYITGYVGLNHLKDGTSNPSLSRDVFGRQAVPLPDLATQRKIAGIFSAYDDLIENNQRRIKILEEMAQSLYREWFVHFRFPGHESARFTASPLGRIPEGWEVVPFTEIAEILSGGTPKTTVDEFWNGEIPFFSPKDAPQSFYVLDTEKKITGQGLLKCASKLYEKDTIFITARGTVGKVSMASRSMAMNQSCYALKGKHGFTQKFLFLTTKEQVAYLKTNTGGATFDTIVVDTFRRMMVVKPPVLFADQFTSKVTPIVDAVDNLLKRNQTLRRTRDLLLPKLLAGDSSVDRAASVC